MLRTQYIIDTSGDSLVETSALTQPIRGNIVSAGLDLIGSLQTFMTPSPDNIPTLMYH